jgi:hypothetical protein
VLAPKAREVRVRRAGEQVVEVADLAAGGRIEAAQDVEQRRFAAAGRSEQHDQLAAVELEVDAAQRLDFHLAHPIGLGETPGSENRCGRNGHDSYNHATVDGDGWASAS